MCESVVIYNERVDLVMILKLQALFRLSLTLILYAAGVEL